MAEEDLIFGKNRHFFGGIEPSNMRKFKASIVDGAVKLDMQLPNDTVVNGHTLCSVAGAVVRRKTDGYPINEFDGELVGDYSVEYLNDQYAETGGYLIDDESAIITSASNGLVVASFKGKGLWYSEDGKTWTQSNANSGTYGYVTCDNDFWVAGGVTVGLWYSEDGKTWTQSNVTSFDSVLNFISRINNIWFASSNSDYIYYSEDGKNWTQGNVQGRYSINYANGIWHVTGMGLYYSTDGKTWISSNSDGPIPDIYMDVYYGNGVWVTFTDIGVIYYSENGKTWTKSSPIVRHGDGFIAYGNNMWIASFEDEGIYYSEDGKTWTHSNVTSGGHFNVKYINDLWIATTYYGNNGVYYSTDGKTWTQSNITSGGQFGTVYYANGKFVMGALDNYVYGLWYSEDGKTWTQSNITSGYFSQIVYNNGAWIASAKDDTDNDATGVYYSEDGMTWTLSSATDAIVWDLEIASSSSDVNIGSSEYYYSAFPYTTQGVYNISPVNRAYVSVSDPSDPSNPDTPSEPVTGSYFYGYDLDLSDSDPATRVSYPEDVDNAAFVAAYMDTSNGIFKYGGWNIAPGEKFMPRPCMLKYDGSLGYYLNPDKYAQKEDGTNSDVGNADYEGNAMMEWPKIYTKRWEENGVYHFRCSDVKLDDNYECWCNYDKNDNRIDHFYTAIYPGAIVSNSSALRSLSGYGGSIGSITSAFTSASYNGDDWTIDTLADRLLIQDLLVMMGKSTDGQAVYGPGRVTDSDTSEIFDGGTFDRRGMFYGTPGANGNTVKVFGMEHWWGNCDRWLAGLVLNNGKLNWKITRGKKDGSNVTDYNLNGNGYISPIVYDEQGTGRYLTVTNGFIDTTRTESYGRLPIGGTGSSTTYECDYLGVLEDTSDIFCARAGGNLASSASCGPFAIDLRLSTNGTSGLTCAALSCKPSAK